ncbi:Protein of unknown function DUF935 [Myroides sp. A21]|uniref:phage portal protein family protein n=1 Tax=Myroides sp. A21 TaxID=1583100 RepID=UPI000585D030|nr:hypothetical protein [Myroides sp. A21]AJA67330.1 Protein of unknown function DUF935 [Myroides sp. A21]
MNWFKTLKTKAFAYVLNRTPLRDLKVYARAKGDSYSNQVQYQAESLMAKSLDDWRTAILMATDPDTPDKSELASLYRTLWLDDHLASTVDSRILFCQRSPFKMVNDAGNENKDITWFFERTWFEEFIRLTLMSRFEGTKVIEIWELDSNGELMEVEEIPMQYVNTKKGIILKSPGDQTGWDFRTGKMADYYIQVGKDKSLGMLADMTPNLLAKKLGVGSWLDYLEKYGVGNLFITTDREDDARLRELAEAAANYRASGYMVGRGNEKFEIKGTEGGNPQNFDLFLERIDNGTSKRILGGSGLTDAKAYVGSTEIQFKLAKDRFESDKLLLKNVINQHLIPRLIKLSPVYAPLKGYYFDWDNTKSQNPTEIKEMISALAPHFELDTEEVSQKTGFKILNQKSTNTNSEQEAKKKSLNLN